MTEVQKEEQSIVEDIWHFLIDDRPIAKPSWRDWEFVTGIFNQNNGTNIGRHRVSDSFYNYFRQKFGVSPFIKCPVCEKGITYPRKSSFVKYLGNYFIGCSRFPECKFIATDKKPFKKSKPKENSNGSVTQNNGLQAAGN